VVADESLTEDFTSSTTSLTCSQPVDIVITTTSTRQAALPTVRYLNRAIITGLLLCQQKLQRWSAAS
jgi:hypothetical protein